MNTLDRVIDRLAFTFNMPRWCVLMHAAPALVTIAVVVIFVVLDCA